MKKYRYLVLGTGVGKAIAHLLLQFPDTQFVTVTDEVFAQACEVAKKLSATGRCIPFEYHTTRNPELMFGDHDAVISALPARYNVDLARTAIKIGIPFCELGGVTEITDKILALRGASESVITDCGLMPGLGMMLGRHLIDWLDETESVKILVGGLPQRPRPPVNYQRVFSIEGLKHLCYDPAEILTQGELKTVPPFSEHDWMCAGELHAFFPHGEIETFVTAGAARTARTFQELGLKEFRELTVRWPGFVDFVKNIPPERFEEEIGPHINIPVSAENPDLVWMQVVAAGKLKAKHVRATHTLFDMYDINSGLTAMERTTGFSTAVLARMAVRRETLPGIHTSECALDSNNLLEYIAHVTRYLPGLSLEIQQFD